MNHFFKKITQCCFISSIVLLSACDTTDSDNIKSSGIHADISVTSSGSGITEVNVQLKSGSGGIGGTVIELEGSDTLFAESNGVTKTLTEDNDLLNDITYNARFDTDESALYTISFDRPDDVSAPNSTVTLPEPFEILTPEIGQSYLANDLFEVTWSQSGYSDTLPLTLDWSCQTSEQDSGQNSVTSGFVKINVVDTGAYSNSISDISEELFEAANNDKNCTVQITLKRESKGQIDVNYGEGGSINALQKRTRTVLILSN